MVLPRVLPNNKQILKRVTQTIMPKEGEKYVVNRNPRNLEFLRIASKNKGYELDAPFTKASNFWHKLEIISSGKYVTAQVVHFENGPVVQASTKEWCVKKQLYKTGDTSAYVNLARVFAKRCLMSGIIEMTMKPSHGLKIGKFLDILKENGLSLEEPAEIYTHKDRFINRFKGRRMTPTDWKEIVEHH